MGAWVVKCVQQWVPMRLWLACGYVGAHVWMCGFVGVVVGVLGVYVCAHVCECGCAWGMWGCAYVWVYGFVCMWVDV